MAKGNESNKKKPEQLSAREQAKKQAAKNRQQKDKSNRITSREFWKGVKLEMSKVVWPTRKELGTYTAVVIATCAAFALGFWAIDSGFLAILRAVLGITLS